MLGRSTGLSDEQMAHLRDDPLPADVYDAVETVIIRYSQTLTRMEPISDAMYAELREHFSERQVIELCFTVGLSNLVNRFHATFLTDVDESTLDALNDPRPTARLPW